MSVLFTRRGAPTVVSKLLSDYAEGDVVCLNENGSPVEFYVARHNYESGLNGARRALLVRKERYGSMLSWDSGNVNKYEESDLDSWLNSSYKALLDTAVQTAIGSTAFYYLQGNAGGISTLSRSVFIPSVTEYGITHDFGPAQGSSLPIASILARYTEWTRSPAAYYNWVYYAHANTGSNMDEAKTAHYVRPCFTLPSTTLFYAKTNEFMGVK